MNSLICIFYGLVFGILISLAILAAVCTFRRWRVKRLEEELTTAKSKVAELEERSEKQAVERAEASIKLMAKSEKLEEQTFKLAEANVKMLEQKEIIEIERKRSEDLLLNILPVKVAQELKDSGTHVPEHFYAVTVLFADMVDFTVKAEMISAADLIADLNEIFTGFDEICEQLGCERIKTIGDAYLCVCGMPEKCDDHASRIVLAACRFIEFLNQRNETKSIKWQTRIGVDSGPVVAGIVGIKKYIYDVFGNTINMAARMETCSLPMQVNISQATKELLNDEFVIEERGDLPVKGKDRQNMFFVSVKRN